MLRRSIVASFRRSAPLYSKAAAHPSTPKAPQLSKANGATGPEGDSIVDKVVLISSLGAVAAWWVMVPGPQHQH